MLPFGAGDVVDGLRALPTFVDRWGLRGGLRRWLGMASVRATRSIDGRSIFEADWDVCVVLDACRADELTRLAPRHDWIDDVGRFPSVGSSTFDWMPRTFDPETRDLSETVYVCANPFTRSFCDPADFHTLDEVWTYAWDDPGTVRPRPVTDRAIHHWRQTDAERMVVHYLQPHVPFLVEAAGDNSRRNFDPTATDAVDDWDRVTRGELPAATAVEWYRQTLATVLEDVALLRSNIDADPLVVTADHGEAFGERGIYGHPSRVALPCLTSVPWVVTTASDEHTHDPATYDTDSSGVDQAERLRALGYRS